MTRDGFIFYYSFLDAALDMQPKERLAYYDALIGYALEGKEPSVLPKNASIAFKLSRKQIDANNLRYENGKKGGRPKKTDGFENQKPMVLENGKYSSENEKPKEKEKEKENVKDKEKKESVEKKVAAAPAPQQRMVKPSVVDVADYAAKMGYTGFHTERFYSYYESNGWRVGKNPMKDWKAAVRNWHQRDLQEKQPRKLTYDELHPIGDFSHEFTSI